MVFEGGKEGVGGQPCPQVGAEGQGGGPVGGGEGGGGEAGGGVGGPSRWAGCLGGEHPPLPQPDQGGRRREEGQHCADHQADPLLQCHLALGFVFSLWNRTSSKSITYTESNSKTELSNRPSDKFGKQQKAT